MSEMERYREYMDRIHAPESLYAKVLQMGEKEKNRGRHMGRRALLLAVAAVLLTAMGVAAAAATPYIMGWAGNLVISREHSGSLAADGALNIGEMTAPVELRDGRMIFIVNGEHIDITDKVSESEAFMYEYTDDEGISHHWLVGISGPEPENYGFGEFLYEPGNGWVGGYGSNHIAPDGNEAEWFVTGKARLGVPWR